MALHKRNLAPADEDHLVQIVVQQLYNKKHDSNKCLEVAARKIVQKYSPLKKSLDPLNKALVIKLRRRRNRLNLSKSNNKDNQNDSSEGRTPDEAIAEMKRDWGAGIRSVSHFRANMAITRFKREGQVVRTPALQLFRVYPALHLTDIMMEEFEIEVNVKKENMITNWKKNLPFIVEHFCQSKIDIDRTPDEAAQTFAIMEKIHLLPLWYKKTKAAERDIKVLQTFPENTPPEEMKPSDKESPRLICSGSFSPTTLCILCYLDGQSYFAEPDHLQSLLLLFAAYFVLGIKWGPRSRLPLVFLFCASVGVERVVSDVTRNNKLQALLKNLHII